MATNANIYGVQMTPVNTSSISPYGTWRGLGSEWFNAQNVAREDWQRAEQSANNEFYRSLGLQQDAQGFNASEAQKQRDFEKMMSDTAYQRAVQDMQKAGINPILAYSQGGASTPQGASASSTSAPSSGSNAPRGTGSQSGSLLGSLVSLAGGLINTAHQHRQLNENRRQFDLSFKHKSSNDRDLLSENKRQFDVSHSYKSSYDRAKLYSDAYLFRKNKINADFVTAEEFADDLLKLLAKFI